MIDSGDSKFEFEVKFENIAVVLFASPDNFEVFLYGFHRNR